jgi:hypothetical protein
MTGGDMGCDTAPAGGLGFIGAIAGAAAALGDGDGETEAPPPFTAGDAPALCPWGEFTSRWPPVRAGAALADGGEEPLTAPSLPIRLPHEPQNRAPASTPAPH